MMLSIQNLIFSWLHEPLFENVSISLEKGKCVLLKGENGSGKTTLLQLIAGMIPHFSRGTMLEGEIFLNGRSVFKEHPRAFFPTVAYVPGKNIDFFLFNENLTEERLMTQAILNISDKMVFDKRGQFSQFFPDLQTIENLPFKQMQLSQKILSLLFIYYLQGAQLFLLDEVLHSFSSGDDLNNWFRFMEFQTRCDCSIILVSHQIETKECLTWEIKDKKIIC